MVSYPNKISSTPVCNILNDCSLKETFEEEMLKCPLENLTVHGINS